MKSGEKAKIKHLLQNEFTTKLITLGVLPNKEVVFVQKSPFGGAVYLSFENHHLALRKEEADTIIIFN